MNQGRHTFIQLFFYFFITICITCICAANKLLAQTPTKKTTVPQNNVIDTSDQSRLLHTIHADREGFRKFSDTSQIKYYAGKVALRQNKTLFYCDSAVYNVNTNIVEAFGHVHINDNDSVNIYSDYLRYQSNDKKAFLKNKVRLSDNKSTLTTEQLDYDLNTRTAIYNLNGKLVSDSTVLTSGSGTYFADTRDATFSQDVILIDPQYTIKTDTLQYNSYSKIATFTVPTLITSQSRSIQTSDGWYDQIHRKGYFSKRPILKDSASTLIADEVAFNDSLGAGEAAGNVIYKDTVENIMVLCNNLKTNRNHAAFLATINPVMIVKQGNDSTFIAADTLYSARYDSTKLQNIAVQPVNNKINPSANPPTSVSNVTANDYSKGKNHVKSKQHYKKVGKTFVWKTDQSAKKTKTPKSNSKENLQYKKVGKTFVWQSDNAISNDDDRVNTSYTVINKKESKGLLSIFKKKEKDTIPSRQENINNTEKNMPGVIDSLRNVKSGQIDSAAFKQAGNSIDLTHKTAINENDSLAPENKHNRYFEAYFRVRIYNDSMQSICDSLYYDARDSVFQLFNHPVVWTTSNHQISQISGDTIYLYTANNKPEYLKVWNNSIMLSQADSLHNPKTSNYYNQMSGRAIDGWFTNGQIDSLKARGDARSVFYMLDNHNKYIGVNTQNSRTLDFYFLDKELNKIIGRNDVVGKTYPMREVNHESIRLKGFEWLDNKRPKSKYELLAH